MSKYKKFFILNPDKVPSEAYTMQDRAPLWSIGAIETVELAALEACQKRLYEACELLQACLDHFEDPYTSSSPIIKIDTFLENIKDVGE